MCLCFAVLILNTSRPSFLQHLKKQKNCHLKNCKNDNEKRLSLIAGLLHTHLIPKQYLVTCNTWRKSQAWKIGLYMRLLIFKVKNVRKIFHVISIQNDLLNNTSRPKFLNKISGKPSHITRKKMQWRFKVQMAVPVIFIPAMCNQSSWFQSAFFELMPIQVTSFAKDSSRSGILSSHPLELGI
jgi:hypothetical protein